MIFNDFSDVLLYVFAWCGSTYWQFNLFGIEWSIPILQIWFLPLYGAFFIFIIKKIYDIVNE